MFRDLLDASVNFLFPQREKEKMVQSLSPSEIFTLPKAKESRGSIISLFSYKDKRVQALIWELKYHRNSRALEIIGALLAESITEEVSDKILFENWQAKNMSMLLVPIPVTDKRLRERKFSQTDLLCREIMKHIGTDISYAPDALKKIRETEKQSWSKSREERLRNLHGAFSANQHVVSGKNIILIDDVTTTGATISEAVRALNSAHAKKIIAFTIAH